MNNPHVTVVVNGHREGLIASPTLWSVDCAVEEATSHGLSVEIIAVLDRADALTKEIFDRWISRRSDARLLSVDHGDLGRSRNSGVEEATGKWVAFIDADDLWGRQWLSHAHKAAEAESR